MAKTYERANNSGKTPTSDHKLTKGKSRGNGNRTWSLKQHERRVHRAVTDRPTGGKLGIRIAGSRATWVGKIGSSLEGKPP